MQGKSQLDTGTQLIMKESRELEAAQAASNQPLCPTIWYSIFPLVMYTTTSYHTCLPAFSISSSMLSSSCMLLQISFSSFSLISLLVLFLCSSSQPRYTPLYMLLSFSASFSFSSSSSSRSSSFTVSPRNRTASRTACHFV